MGGILRAFSKTLNLDLEMVLWKNKMMFPDLIIWREKLSSISVYPMKISHLRRYGTWFIIPTSVSLCGTQIYTNNHNINFIYEEK